MAIVQLPLPLFNQPETIEIQLRDNIVAIVDVLDKDLGQFRWSPNTNNNRVRVSRHYTENGKDKSVFIHRVIMERILGRPLKRNELVDHRDGDQLNNRRSNLRLATHTQNMQNRRKHKGKSGYKGVHQYGFRWHAIIQADKKRYLLGIYDNPEDAYEAYCKASKELHGEFSRLE